MMLALLVAAAAACPSDQLISLDLKAWKAHFPKYVPGSDEQHAAMAALRMKTVPEGAETEDPCIDKPVVEGIDVVEANLTGMKDKLVQVRFRMCKGTPDEWQSLRLAVLVPQGRNQYCLLEGEDLSVDRAASNRACENPGKLPMTFALREVLQKGRKVVETREEQGSCEMQMSSITLALYRAQGWSLAKIFDTVVLDAHGGHTQKSTVTYTGPFPRDIHVEKCVEKSCESEDFAWDENEAKYLPK